LGLVSEEQISDLGDCCVLRCYVLDTANLVVAVFDLDYRNLGLVVSDLGTEVALPALGDSLSDIETLADEEQTILVGRCCRVGTGLWASSSIHKNLLPQEVHVGLPAAEVYYHVAQEVDLG